MKTTAPDSQPAQPTRPSSYSTVAIVLHWLLGLSLFALFALGIYMSDLPFSPERLKLYNYHKWAGISFLFFSVLRLLWRFTHRPPALPVAIEQAMPTWQARVYHATHYVMYLLFIAVPLLGWAYSSAAGFPVVVFGVLPLPDLLAVDKEFAKYIKEWHEIAAMALMVLATLHVAAALKHHFIDKDNLISRMLPNVTDQASVMQILQIFESLTMMKLKRILLSIIASVASLYLQPVFAQQKLLAAQSGISFTFKQMGVPVEGKFTKFDAQINFDAKQLATSKVAFTVDIASATLGDKATDAELPKAPWFNTAKFPQASFASSSIKAMGGGKFDVQGKLSIKGVSQDVTVPVAMTQAGAITTAAGTFAIKRLTFKIGENEWADTSMVADPVQVKFKIALSGVGKL